MVVFEICRVKTIAARVAADRQAGVEMPWIGLHDLRGCAQGWLPRDDVAEDRIEDEAGRPCNATRRSEDEITGGVGDCSGRQSATYGNRLWVRIQRKRTAQHVAAK